MDSEFGGIIQRKVNKVTLSRKRHMMGDIILMHQRSGRLSQDEEGAIMELGIASF